MLAMSFRATIPNGLSSRCKSLDVIWPSIVNLGISLGCVSCWTRPGFEVNTNRYPCSAARSNTCVVVKSQGYREIDDRRIDDAL